MKWLYTDIRDWVDRSWRENHRLLLLPLMIMVPLGAVLKDQSPIIAPIFVMFSAFWLVFIFYRCWLYLKESSIKSGRLYERLWRYKLPPEYADSEDAWTAAERRKHAKKTMRQRQRKP